MNTIRNLDDKKIQGDKWVKVIETCDTKNGVICVTTSHGSQDDQILDTTYPFHMCANKKLFYRYKPYDANDVVMSNDSRRKVMGKGSIKLVMFYGVVQTLGV